jgi:hypothetical protein
MGRFLAGGYALKQALDQGIECSKIAMIFFEPNITGEDHFGCTHVKAGMHQIVLCHTY